MRSARRVFYSGRVQGVGFRWTTRSIVKHHPVAGWVRNLPDGRVEMLVEGETSDLDVALAAIDDRFAGMIREKTVVPESPTGLSGPFEITFA